MKRCLAVLLAALVALTLERPPTAKAAAVSFGFGARIHAIADFNAPLSPFGSWVTVRTFGRVWHPTRIAVGWRPYSNGQWVWTSAGWFWQSDEPWAWATYHYGSWHYDDSLGWVWIPGLDWAPAWVSWRYSPAYIGWAPIGPNMVVMAPSFFMFIGVNRFRGARFRTGDLIVNNVTIINKTQPVENFERETVKVDGEERTIYSNKGPGVGPIEEATGEKITERPVEEVARETPPPQNLPGAENQPETKPGEKPGNETALPPTGNEQPAQPPVVIPPTGGEQENKYEHPEQTPPSETVSETPSEPPVITPPSTEHYNDEQRPQRPLSPTGRPGSEQPSQSNPSETHNEAPVITPPSTEHYNQEHRPSRPLSPTGRPGSEQPSQSNPSLAPAERPSVVTPPSTDHYNQEQRPNRPPQTPPQQQLPPTGRPGSGQPPQSAPSQPPIVTPPPPSQPPSRPQAAPQPPAAPTAPPQQQLPPTGGPSGSPGPQPPAQAAPPAPTPPPQAAPSRPEPPAQPQTPPSKPDQGGGAE